MEIGGIGRYEREIDRQIDAIQYTDTHRMRDRLGHTSTYIPASNKGIGILCLVYFSYTYIIYYHIYRCF